MALQLNDLGITPRVGAYVYMPNVPQPHNCIVSPNQETPLKAGDAVTYDTTVVNTNCPVVVKAGTSDPIIGVIPSDVRKNTYVANEKVAIAIEGSYLYFIAGNAITQGAKVVFNENGQVVAGTGSVVGVANTSATALGDFVQVKLKFETTTA